MYEFIRGTIAELNPASITVEAGGIGYFIKISLNTYSKLNGKKEGLLLLHQVVREDAHILFGFSDTGERELFRNLISVNGVGASTAIMMLSSLNQEELVSAVTTENVPVLTSVKGIGAKTAGRVVLELKNKVSHLSLGKVDKELTIDNDVLEALCSMGYTNREARDALEAIDGEIKGVENKIRAVLKILAK